MNLPYFTRFISLLKCAHWCTEIHSRHTVLEDLYDTVSDATDEFVEVYAGILDPEFEFGPIQEIPHIDDDNLQEIIEDEGKDFVDHLRGMARGDKALDSITDGIEVALNKAQYLLRMSE